MKPDAAVVEVVMPRPYIDCDVCRGVPFIRFTMPADTHCDAHYLCERCAGNLGRLLLRRAREARAAIQAAEIADPTKD